MFEKIKNLFKEKDDKKKMENLIAFLIILVVTLIIVNKILKSDDKTDLGINQNQTGVQFVDKSEEEKAVLVNSGFENNIEESLENILSKISGVR